MIAPPTDETIAHVVALRRAIHRHPELGFEERETSALVCRELEALGIPFRRLAQTGVVGVLRGGLPGRVAALRADMDALPIGERSGESFASEIAGKMHACGHDAHTAMLLGAARTLAATRQQLAGSVVFIFQPAEEGPGGAEPMIAQGALDDPSVDAIAMLHVDTRLRAGAVSVTPGPVNAACDELRLRVRGQGGHGAYPHTAVDTLPASAALILALQNIAARETDPLASVVVTIGQIEGGYRNNVIADEVRMAGTLRSHDPSVRDGLDARVRRIAGGVGATYGVEIDVDIVRGYPPVVNDPALAESFAAYLRAQLPTIEVRRLPPTMGGEDFAYFAQRVPGLHVRLGICGPSGTTPPGHSAEFRIDEAALPVGVETLCAFATGVASGVIGG